MSVNMNNYITHNRNFFNAASLKITCRPLYNQSNQSNPSPIYLNIATTLHNKDSFQSKKPDMWIREMNFYYNDEHNNEHNNRRQSNMFFRYRNISTWLYSIGRRYVQYMNSCSVETNINKKFVSSIEIYVLINPYVNINEVKSGNIMYHPNNSHIMYEIIGVSKYVTSEI